MLLPSRLALVVVAFVAACADEQEVADCGCPTTPAACDGCPEVAVTLCIAGACTDRGTDDAVITADVSIQRGLEGVVGVTIAVLDARGSSCGVLRDPLTAEQNVLSGTRVDVSGGPFHEDLGFGTVPAGTVLVAADGLDVDGDVVGRGCVVFDVVAGNNDVGVVTISP